MTFGSNLRDEYLFVHSIDHPIMEISVLQHLQGDDLQWGWIINNMSR